jgi:hypothetical protein
VLSLRQRSWTHVRVAVATVTVFTFLTLIATIVHAHRLHLPDADPLARAAARFWLAIYVAVPLVGVVVIGRQEEGRPRRDGVLRPLPPGRGSRWPGRGSCCSPPGRSSSWADGAGTTAGRGPASGRGR